jgi:hypothetical protein
MNAPAKPQEFTVHFHPRRGDAALADLLRREIEGDVLFDRFSRGRYSTDASIYQVDPVGVVIPKNARDAETAFRIAMDQGIPVMPTFHPNYLLRNDDVRERRKVWEDLMQVMERLGLTVTERHRSFFLKGT